MRDYDPEANKEVGASPKSSAPPTADSQAGDELRSLLVEGGYRLDTNTGIGRTIAFIEAYAERRATEARIAILSKVDPLAGMMILRPDGMEHEIKVMDYVTELKAALTKEIQSS